MGLWDGVSDFFSGGGRDDINNGYAQAGQYLNPYQQGGNQNYQQMQGYLTNWGNNLNQYNNAGANQYNSISQSPTDYYNNIMNSYSQSPEAKYAQDQAYNASTRGASASGMLGSGAQLKGLQTNANLISQNDRQQYFNNVMNSNNAQMNALQNLQGQQGQYRNMMQYLTQLGYGANEQGANNAINQGMQDAKIDQSSFDSLAGLVGFGGQNFRDNMMNPGVSSLPRYMWPPS